jgi:hypothetical protein
LGANRRVTPRQSLHAARRAGASARDTRVGAVRDFPRHACVPCHAPKHPKHFFRLLPYSTPPRRPTLKGLGAGRGRPRGFSAFWRVGRHGSASRLKLSIYFPALLAANIVCLIDCISAGTGCFPRDLAKVNFHGRAKALLAPPEFSLPPIYMQ